MIMSPVAYYTVLSRDPFCLVIMQHVVVLCTLLMGFMMFVRVHGGACQSNDITKIWHCNPQATSKSLPQDFAVLLMLLPISG